MQYGTEEIEHFFSFNVLCIYFDFGRITMVVELMSNASFPMHAKHKSMEFNKKYYKK